MTYYVNAKLHDGSEDLYKFSTEDKARDWCYNVGWENERYYHLQIVTDNGKTLVANIPTGGITA
jgi:hypothetical protein